MIRGILSMIFLSITSTETLKTPEYNLIETHGKIEIREYS